MIPADLEKLIAEIAKNHKVVLGPDDPIVMLLSVNRFLINELAVSQTRMIQEFCEALATSSSDWQNRSNRRAESVLNASVTAAKNAVAAGAEAGITAGHELFIRAAGKASSQIESQLQEARKISRYLTIIVVWLTLCLAGALGAILLRVHPSFG